MRSTHRRSTPHESGPRPSAPARPGAYRPRTRLKGERGYVLVMSALLMLPLLAFAGFAIDIGFWYTHANRMQRAADAAALAAVVWMPNDERATEVALETARANGFDDADADITVTVTPVGNRRVRVHIHDADVEMYLSSLFLDNVDIERQSLAEYVQSVPMGSPEQTLGNDPDKGFQPFFWLNTGGPLTRKDNGDRHTAGVCTGFSGCSGSTNLDYSETGYFYRVTVDTKPASGDLEVQVFDPAFVQQGDQCNVHMLDPANSNYTTRVNDLVAQGMTDAATRYVRGNTNFCPGDHRIHLNPSPPSVVGLVETTYLLREPDNTPFDNTDNPVICAVTFDAYNQDTYDLLMNPNPIGSENMAFRDHFRQWTSVCSVPWNDVVVGDYLLQVTTTADQSSPPASLENFDDGVSTGGHNRYALRAGFGDPTSASFATGLNLFADGRLPIYANQNGGGDTTNFFLARIAPEYAGQVLELEFYDVADTPGTANLTIVPPADMTGDGITACTFIRDATPPQVISPGNCTITGLTSANYNGRVVTVQIPLAENYDCAAGSDLGCWFKVDLTFTDGTPNDTTTWSARVRGDPVRLVE